MLGSEILEIAIGLVFVFLIASLIATTVRETVESVLKTRAIQLERGLRQLLDDPSGTGVTKELFDHPLLYGLFAGDYNPQTQLTKFWIPWRRGSDPAEQSKRISFGSTLPNYIPSRNFALALLHVVSGSGSDQNGVLSLQAVKANALTLPEGRLRQALLVALGEAENDLDRARTSLEAWFDGTMDRVSGWYKRETQWVLLGLGLLLAIVLNIDSLGITRDLATNNQLRQAMIAHVDANYSALKSSDLKLSPEDLDKQKQGLSDVIGWPRFQKRVDDDLAKEKSALSKKASGDAQLSGAQAQAEWMNKQLSGRGTELWWTHLLGAIPGWLVTALAVSLGAPFWFDLLNKFVVIRSTVKPYEKSPAEGSEDRAGSPPSADRLAPQPGAAVPPGPVPPGGAGQGAAAPTLVTLRLAIDGLANIDPNSLRLTKNDQQVEVPSDGQVELPLEVETSHRLRAQATRGGTQVAWEQTLTPTFDDEARPLTVQL
jgi:hypothetical protein